jgi:AcrR family transcriptional regulator
MTLTRRRTKTDYLDTALALANELCPHPHAYVVAHVDMAQVARAAGVSRTALYRLWDTQESFRAELAAYMAAHDDAPWMAEGGLDTDPRPLLRAGIAGLPQTDDLTAVIAERERSRVTQQAAALGQALRQAGRQTTPGIAATDVSLLASGMADGLALAARITPPEVSLAVPDRGDRHRPLLPVALELLVDGLSQGDRPAGSAPIGRVPRGTGGPASDLSVPGPSEARVEHSGRRLDYLRLAAELAGREPTHDEPGDSYALGYVSLDALARAEGVTRAAVRKQWPTQAEFRPDLFAHLLGRHRRKVLDHVGAATHPGDAGEALLALGDVLFDQVQADMGLVSHLSFAPQLVLPRFRTYVHRHVRPLLTQAGAALSDLLAAVGRQVRPELDENQTAVVVLAFLDGMTRMGRTHPDLRARRAPHGDHTHSLVAVGFESLLLGLSRPFEPRPVDAIDLRTSRPALDPPPTRRTTS